MFFYVVRRTLAERSKSAWKVCLFYDFKSFIFILAENELEKLWMSFSLYVWYDPWHLETTNITQLAALGCDYARLSDEYIGFLKNTIQTWTLFSKKMENNKNTSNFGI